MRRQSILRFWPLLLVIGLAAFTWPRDDTGTPAPSCSFFDAGGNVRLCSAGNPMPSGQGPQPNAGTAWFKATTFSGGTPTTGVAAQWTGNRSLFGYTANSLDQIELYSSTDSGSTWTRQRVFTHPLPNTQGLATNNRVFYLQRAGSSYVLTGGCSVAAGSCSPFMTVGLDGVPVAATQAGLGSGAQSVLAFEAQQQAGTLLSFVTGSPGGPHVCTSSTSQVPPGTSWTCTAQSATFTTAAATSGEQIGSPAVNTWLVITTGTGAGKQIFRSTDNGATWSLVFTFANDATAGGMQALKCLTGSICVATNNTRIARSSDAGATWTEVVPNAGAPKWSSFINFGSGQVVAAGDAGNTSSVYYLSSDFGVTWAPGPTVSLSVLLGSNQPHRQVVINGAQVVINPGATSGFIYQQFSPTPAGTVISGVNGNTLAPNPDGSVNVTLTGTGTGSAIVRQGAPDVVASPASNAWYFIPPTIGNRTNNTSTGGYTASQSVSAANAAVSVTWTQQTNSAWHLISVEARCSAGTSGLTATDGGTTIWSTGAAEVGTTNFVRKWDIPLIFSAATPTVTLATCGAANTGTLIVQAVRD